MLVRSDNRLSHHILQDVCQLLSDQSLDSEFFPILRRHICIHMIGLSFSSVTSEHLDGSLPLRLQRLHGSKCQSISDSSKIL